MFVLRVVHRVILLFVISGCCAICIAQSGPNPPKPLVGVWGTEQMLGPRVRGDLTIDGRGGKLRARICGYDLLIRRKGSGVRFELPSQLGEFRGKLTQDSRRIIGHWIQPTSSILFQRYATPVELVRKKQLVWTGEVRPLDERISFYVSIQQARDGSLTAVIRNPEFGWLSRGSYRVEFKNQTISLSNGQNQISGSYDAATDQLLLGLLNASPAPLALSRRTESNASGFFPRTPPQLEYTYHQPVSEKDGWQTASLEDVGIELRTISALMQSILGADPHGGAFVPIHSILIARHGKLVLEEYFHGFDPERTHDMRSAGKTLAPILVGIARDHGAKIGPATPVYSLFPDYQPFANWDPRKARLTVADLMTMTPGLACNDSDGSSPGREGQMQSQTDERDWYKYTLNLPMARDPGGTTAIYCSASLNLVGGVAERASRVWNGELFDRYLARPLQFGLYHLNLMPTGAVYTGGGAYLRPRDELKLGQLYLAKGVWNGRRVISREWVERSVAYHSTFARPVVETDLNHQYGYGWHIHHFTVNGQTYREFAAEGAGGQFVMVIPELDMVVGINGGDYQTGNWYRWGLEVIPQYLIPSATGN